MLKHGINILLVEDDSDDYFFLKNKLSSHPDFYKVENFVHKESLEDALDHLKKHSVDIILTDLGLSESHGLETFINLHSAHPELPIIVLTGLEDEKTTREIIQKGAQDYLIKGSIDGERLMRSIAYALERHETTSKLKLILETAREAFVSVDQTGMITEWNRQAGLVLGWKPEEIIGKSFVEKIITPSFRNDYQNRMSHFIKTGEGNFFLNRSELTALHRDGHEIPIELSVSPLKTKSGVVFNVFIQDITERKRLDRLKDEFISMASHELRTPMAIIQTAIKNLTSNMLGSLNEAQLKVAKIIEGNATRLNKIVNNLLDISRLESGQINPKFSKVCLKKMLDDVFLGLDKLAEQKGILFTSHLSDSLPKDLVVDEELVVQVVNNITSNALRYAASRITIDVKPVEEGIEFSVGNDGSYLSPQDISKLFKKFSQVKRPSGGTGYKGTGLGLAICKEIIAKHKGRIWVESTEGHLTVFKFIIPFNLGDHNE